MAQAAAVATPPKVPRRRSANPMRLPYLLVAPRGC